ncbi:uncharacterized protein LOC124126789 [Haliotis rufescens]|uniref:uncharacterized protein LOC124126789 n=1 Tax=Haliotis rufescens TaxID=6454 RepID=UPI001EAFA482|nr:uncharacterized protein LOC124126789 [Haliotis rufescens]
MKFAALLLLGMLMARAQNFDRCDVVNFLWWMDDLCHLTLLRYYVTLDGVLTQQDIHSTLNAVCSEVTEERRLCAFQRTVTCDNRDTLRSFAAVNGICIDDHPSPYALQLLASIPPRVNASCMVGEATGVIRSCTEVVAWRAAFGFNRSMSEAAIVQHHQIQVNRGVLCMYSGADGRMARCAEEEGKLEGLKAAYLLFLLAYAPPGFTYNHTYITDTTDRH